MSDLQFSRAEIQSLAQKLDSPQVQLSDREKQLLVAIFAAAGERARSVAPEDSGGAKVMLAELRQQLLIAFVLDNDGDFIITIPDYPGTIGPGQQA